MCWKYHNDNMSYLRYSFIACEGPSDANGLIIQQKAININRPKCIRQLQAGVQGVQNTHCSLSLHSWIYCVNTDDLRNQDIHNYYKRQMPKMFNALPKGIMNHNLTIIMLFILPLFSEIWIFQPIVTLRSEKKKIRLGKEKNCNKILYRIKSSFWNLTKLSPKKLFVFLYFRKHCERIRNLCRFITFGSFDKQPDKFKLFRSTSFLSITPSMWNERNHY